MWLGPLAVRTSEVWSRPAWSPLWSTSSVTRRRASAATWPLSRSVPRELADVFLPPFEMALRSGARSVMNSYTDLDGVPVASDGALFTELLRGKYGFEGTVVSDYFAVAFLQKLHGVAGSPSDAAQLALTAGIDVELPMVDCYGQPLLDAVASGQIGTALVDRALERVLRQKCELGLLDPDWSAEPPLLREGEAAGRWTTKHRASSPWRSPSDRSC